LSKGATSVVMQRYLSDPEVIFLKDLLNIFEDGQVEFPYSLIYPSKRDLLKYTSMILSGQFS